MGLFSGAGLAYNRMAKSIKETLDNLTLYSYNKEIEYLQKSAWIFRYGVYDSIAKWHWNPSAKIYIPDHQELGMLSLNSVLDSISQDLLNEMKKLPESQHQFIDDILHAGSAYTEVGKIVPAKTKRRLRP